MSRPTATLLVGKSVAEQQPAAGLARPPIGGSAAGLTGCPAGWPAGWPARGLLFQEAPEIRFRDLSEFRQRTLARETPKFQIVLIFRQRISGIPGTSCFCLEGRAMRGPQAAASPAVRRLAVSAQNPGTPFCELFPLHELRSISMFMSPL